MRSPINLKSFIAWIACLVAAAGTARSAAIAQPQSNSAAEPSPRKLFRAGAHAVDITPRKLPVIVNGMFEERTATSVHDPLYSRCLVLDDGSARVAIAVVDNCLMPRELLDEAKRLAHDATGIPTDRILISATHTHSAPSVMGALGSDADAEYSRFLPAKIAEGIELAVKNLAPARVGWAVASAPEHTHCRRWILRPDRVRTDPFGQPTVRAMMHPGYQNPDFVGPAGPVDPALSVFSVQSPDGRPIALLANYSMHYFGAPALSADYFGRFSDKLKELVGARDASPAFVAMMSQGTSGDLHWMDYSQPPRSENIDAFAEKVARLAYEAYAKIQHRDWVPIEMREKKLALSVRLPDAKRLAWAKEVLAGMKGRKPTALPEIYAREQLLLAEQPKRELKLQAVRIGDLGVVGIPCEVFGVTGLKIKAYSPLVPTFVIELANGAEGYIPPLEQHRLGGYTTWEARTAGLEVNAEPMIVEAVLELLEGVSGRPRRKVVEKHGPYAKAVLSSRPAAYWRMGEFNGPRALDATGNANDGEYEGGIAFYLEGPASEGTCGDCHINRAAHFAGGRMKSTVCPAEGGINQPYSVEMWFYNALPSDARAVTGYLFSRGVDGAEGAPGDHLGIGGKDAATGRLLFFNGNTLNQVLAGTTEILPRTWNHVAMVRDGKKVTVYLNGKTPPEICGEAEVGFPPGTKEVFIGGRNDNFANFEGKIDEVAIYGRALSAEEVAEHCAAASSGKKSDSGG